MSAFLYGFQDQNPIQGFQNHQRHLRLDPSDARQLFEQREHHPLFDHHPQIRPHHSPTPHQPLPRLTKESVISSPPDKIYDSTSMSEDHLEMMKSYFHTDTGDTVLFKSWILKSGWDTFLTCIAFLLLAILYEGIKCYREHLYKRLSFAVKKEVTVISNGHNTTSRSSVGGSPPSSAKVNLGSATGAPEPSINPRIFSVPHLIQSGLHVCQVILSYTLMLAFMTFNIWICLSILMGAGIGYFMFYWRKITVVHVTDCH